MRKLEHTLSPVSSPGGISSLLKQHYYAPEINQGAPDKKFVPPPGPQRCTIPQKLTCMQTWNRGRRSVRPVRRVWCVVGVITKLVSRRGPHPIRFLPTTLRHRPTLSEVPLGYLNLLILHASMLNGAFLAISGPTLPPPVGRSKKEDFRQPR